MPNEFTHWEADSAKIALEQKETMKIRNYRRMKTGFTCKKCKLIIKRLFAMLQLSKGNLKGFIMSPLCLSVYLLFYFVFFVSVWINENYWNHIHEMRGTFDSAYSSVTNHTMIHIDRSTTEKFKYRSLKVAIFSKKKKKNSDSTTLKHSDCFVEDLLEWSISSKPDVLFLSGHLWNCFIRKGNWTNFFLKHLSLYWSTFL